MNAAQKRQKAINILRGTGMTDDEIAAELGIGSLDDLTEVSNVIDAEVVEIQDDSGSDNLPALIEGKVYSNTYRSGEPLVEKAPLAEPGTERTWPQGPVPERRCRAHRKNGDQCKNAAILGGTVCRYHGAAPHVKAAARRRLENATDRLAKELLGMATSQNTGETVKLAAIRDALDRGGLGKPVEVVLSQGEPKPYEEVFDGIASVTREDSRRARGITDDSEPFNLADYQHDSSLDDMDRTHPAPASADQGDGWERPTRDDGDSGRPAARSGHGDSSRDRGHPSYPPITGEDAIRLANLTNQRAIEGKR